MGKKRLSNAIKRATEPKPKKPLWKGPSVDGITQSLLSRFLVCRERFRLLVVEGLTEADAFNHRIEYGNMWHLCKEHPIEWKDRLVQYTKSLCERYRTQQEQIQHFMRICEMQYTVYQSCWRDLKSETLLAEEAFSSKYELPSGRIVILRGKWDAVLKVKQGRKSVIYLGENKSKGEIVEQQIQRQLKFDLQTMIYLVALRKYAEKRKFALPEGVRYNVVRRPLSGGKYSISQRKGRQTKKGLVGAETPDQFYARLQGLIESDPEHFFMEWDVGISDQDMKRFEQRFLIPILEQLCDWWESISSNPHSPWIATRSHAWLAEAGPGASSKYPNPLHWQTPYGFYNAMAEGRSTNLDEYLTSGSTLGLERAKTLFRELEE